MTRSKGPAEELSLPPTRMRKDVSTANEGEKENAQGQVQANERNQPTTADMPSPFARPGSRAGTCTTPASEGGMLPIASNPFAWPDSRAGFAPPEPTSPQSSVSSKSDNQLQEDANTSVSWDLVDTDTDVEVANINSSLPHQTVTDQHSTGSTNTTRNNAVGLSNKINTLYNQDFLRSRYYGQEVIPGHGQIQLFIFTTKWKCRAPVEVTGPADILEDRHISCRREDRPPLRSLPQPH